MGRLTHWVLDALAGKRYGSVVSVATREKAVALTFDDGPHPAYTPQVLDLLARHGAKATFFMLGKLAARYPELVKRVHAEGHEIGNHSWDHPSLAMLDRPELEQQLLRTRDVLGPVTGELMRPPYGYQSLKSFRFAKEHGLRPVCWDVAPDDWSGVPADVMADRLLAEVKPGSIVLLHDNLYTFEEPGHRDRGPMLQALDTFLRERADHAFVTVSELMGMGEARTVYWLSDPVEASAHRYMDEVPAPSVPEAIAADRRSVLERAARQVSEPEEV